MRQQIALSRQMEKKAVGNPILTEAPKVEEQKKKKKKVTQLHTCTDLS
jgi:hypothetical protein